MQVSSARSLVCQAVSCDVEELYPVDGLHLEAVDLVSLFIGVGHPVLATRDMLPQGACLGLGLLLSCYL